MNFQIILNLEAIHHVTTTPEPDFLNFWGTQESIPTIQFCQAV